MWGRGAGGRSHLGVSLHLEAAQPRAAARQHAEPCRAERARRGQEGTHHGDSRRKRLGGHHYEARWVRVRAWAVRAVGCAVGGGRRRTGVGDGAAARDVELLEEVAVRGDDGEGAVGDGAALRASEGWQGGEGVRGGWEE